MKQHTISHAIQLVIQYFAAYQRLSLELQPLETKQRVDQKYSEMLPSLDYLLM